MQKELGSAEQIAQRHDARMHRIRTIENQMLRMQHTYRQQCKIGTRSFGYSYLESSAHIHTHSHAHTKK